jgi:hypothetical protein
MAVLQQLELTIRPEPQAYAVLRWRIEQFYLLGFDLAATATLAAGDSDLALARRLLAAGCPHDTARRILL